MNGGVVTCLYKIKQKKTKYTNLMISIKKKHFENIAYELVKNVSGDCINEICVNEICINEIFELIITYFTKYYGGADREKINEKWNNRPQIPSSSIAYYLLAMIIHLYEEENNITQTSTVVIPRKEEVEFYTSLD